MIFLPMFVKIIV